MRIALLFLAGLVAIASAKRYDGYKVVTAQPETAEDVALIRKAVANLGLDQWTDPKAVGAPIDILMTTRQANSFLKVLQSKHVPVQVKIDDVQKVIDEQEARRASQPMKTSRAFDHTAYHRLEDIYATLDGLTSDFPSLVSHYTAGTTYEGRDIRVTAISSGGGGSRDAIWIDCGIHAREWVSPATCQWILDQLTSGYGSDGGVTALLDAYDFHVMTVTNPDGYAFTWDSDRLWRKNRVPFGSGCFGTDPNRNFDSAFGGPGTSNDPCSDIHHGPSAFSEAESSAVRDSVNALGSRLKMFITIHSYSQYWMTPYGYDYTLPANYDEQYRVAGIGVSALEAVHGTQYTYGNIADVIYLAAGGSSDWAYDGAGVQYAFAIELRDTGSWGFLLPPEQIVPTGEETWTGIMAAINAI